MKRAELHGRIFAYQNNQRFFAQISDGLEEEGAAELRALGARDAETVFRGIHFSASLENIYSIVYQTRLCSRVLAPLIYFDCHSPKYLYKTARQIPWEIILGKKDSFAISATVAHSRILPGSERPQGPLSYRNDAKSPQICAKKRVLPRRSIAP